MRFNWRGAAIFCATGIAAISVLAGIVALAEEAFGAALAAGLVAAVSLAIVGGIDDENA